MRILPNHHNTSSLAQMADIQEGLYCQPKGIITFKLGQFKPEIVVYLAGIKQECFALKKS